MSLLSLAAFRHSELRRLVAALFVWSAMWSAAAAVNTHANAKPASVDLPFVFCAFGSEAPGETPAQAPAGEGAAAGHCVMCLAGAGPALPPPERGVGAPSLSMAISVLRERDAATIGAFGVGTVGARAPPRAA
jgi:hypothetical protein